MKVTAHRGYSGLYPENTMLAFQRAVEAGSDEIELDVQLAKDGTVVIVHDETLERLTGVKGMVKDLTFGELKKLNISTGVYKDKFGFNPIPSLDEYLSWIKDTGIVTNIELKNSCYYYEGMEEKVISMIKQYNIEEKIILSSFNHLSLAKCKKLCPSIPCGVLSETYLEGGIGYYIRSNNLDFFHPNIDLLSDEIAEDCKKHGVEINVWTVNDMGELLKAKTLNCRGVITNYPDVCKAWLSSPFISP